MPAAQASEYRRLSLSAGAEYTTGRYGGSDSTEITYVPVVLRYQADDTSYRLTIPYLSVTTTGFVEAEGVVVGGGGGQRTSQSGLGDVIGAVTTAIVSDHRKKFFVDVTGKLKLPTADANSGLGTGKPDYAAQLTLSKDFDRTAAFGAIAYKVVGSPPGVQLRNVASGFLGGSYRFLPATAASLIADLGQSTLPSRETKRLLTAELAHRFDRGTRVRVFLLKGFSTSSPDKGAGILLTHSF
jgi:hypothetical protein